MDDAVGSSCMECDRAWTIEDQRTEIGYSEALGLEEAAKSGIGGQGSRGGSRGIISPRGHGACICALPEVMWISVYMRKVLVVRDFRKGKGAMAFAMSKILEMLGPGC